MPKLRRKSSTKTIYFEDRKLEEPTIQYIKNKSEMFNNNILNFDTRVYDIEPFRKKRS